MRIAVIGAGPAGLAATRHLLTRMRPRPAVCILDGAGAPGGLASGFKGESDWSWPLERFYHHLFTNDDCILELTREAGLSHLLQEHAPVTSFRYEQANYRLDGPLHLLSFPHLSPLARLRTGLAMAYLRWHPRPPWLTFDRTTAHAWLQRYAGRAAYDVLWRPLLAAKFGSFYKEVSMAWFAARIIKRTARLLYLKGGFQAWADGLLQANLDLGAEAKLKTSVKEVRRESGSLIVRAGAAETSHDAVLFTGQPRQLCSLCPQLPSSYREKAEAERFLGAAVLTLATDRSLTGGHYWVSIPDYAQLPFLVLVEHTAMIDPRYYGGRRIHYLGTYVEPGHRFLVADAAEVTEEILEGLRKFDPLFRSDEVQGAWLHRTGYAQPVPVTGYGTRRLPLRTPLKGLYAATMSQVWPWDRGTNYAVEIGQEAAARVQSDLESGICLEEPGTAPSPSARIPAS